MIGVLHHSAQFGVVPAIIVGTERNLVHRQAECADRVPNAEELDARFGPTVRFAKSVRFPPVWKPLFLAVDFISLLCERLQHRQRLRACEAALADQAHQTARSVGSPAETENKHIVTGLVMLGQPKVALLDIS